MKLSKTIPALLCALLLLAGVSITAFAQEIPDLSKQGSISVTMSYEGNPVSGGSITVYRVAELTEENGDFSYALTDDFSGAGVSLETLDSSLAESLAAFAEENALVGTSESIGSDGKATIENLPTGLYLVVEREAADGFKPISPFLVSVPTEENNAYVYEVDATPKMSLLTAEDTSSEVTSEDTSSETSSGDTSESTSSEETSSSEKLPQTGQHNLPVLLLAVAGLSLLLIGFAIRGGSDEA